MSSKLGSLPVSVSLILTIIQNISRLAFLPSLKGYILRSPSKCDVKAINASKFAEEPEFTTLQNFVSR